MVLMGKLCSKGRMPVFIATHKIVETHPEELYIIYSNMNVLTSPGVKIDPSDVHSLVFGSADELYLVWKVW